jgi:hypothetical protein
LIVETGNRLKLSITGLIITPPPIPLIEPTIDAKRLTKNNRIKIMLSSSKL